VRRYRQELDLLRGEVKEYIQTQREMDAEAEELEGELKVAHEHITQLQAKLQLQALRQSQEGVAA
jgi:chromosome segregation ATPase